MTNGIGAEIVLWLFTIVLYTIMASIPVILFFTVVNIVMKPVRRTARSIKTFNK